MLRLQQILPTPNGVQPSGTGSLNLPLGATYYTLGLDISDGTTQMTQAALDARIKNIRLKLNGIQVRQYNTVSELININSMHGIPTKFGAATGDTGARVVMYFAEPQRRTPFGEDVFAWKCYQALGINSFTLEFDVTSSASASINVQVFREYSQFDSATVAQIANNGGFGNIIWHSSQLLPNDSAGLPTTSTLQRTAYTRIHAYAAEGVLAGAQVKVNDLVIRDFRTYAEYADYMKQNQLTTIANWLTVPFDETNRYDELLDLRQANSFVMRYTTAAAGSITLLLEELKGL